MLLLTYKFLNLNSVNNISLTVNYILGKKEMDGMDETSKRILEPYQYLLQLPGKFLCIVLS